MPEPTPTPTVAPPHADFYAVPTTVSYQLDPTLTVTFTDLSTGEITKWEWDFDGDAFIDSTYYVPTNPIHSYPKVNRTYTVSLTVTGPGGVDVETKINYILVTGCPS